MFGNSQYGGAEFMDRSGTSLAIGLSWVLLFLAIGGFVVGLLFSDPAQRERETMSIVQENFHHWAGSRDPAMRADALWFDWKDTRREEGYVCRKGQFERWDETIVAFCCSTQRGRRFSCVSP